MDQIHLSPLVDQIQLALGHISNSLRLAQGVLAPDNQLVRMSSFRLRPRRGPRNVAPPRHADSPSMTRGAPVPHAMQAHQLAARAGNRLLREP
jgi:hypothetical protein